MAEEVQAAQGEGDVETAVQREIRAREGVPSPGSPSEKKMRVQAEWGEASAGRDNEFKRKAETQLQPTTESDSASSMRTGALYVVDEEEPEIKGDYLWDDFSDAPDEEWGIRAGKKKS